MKQLSLRIAPRLSYSGNNFLLHSGVRLAATSILNSIQADRFALFFVQGEKRSGKTHLSIFLAHELSQRGIFPTILEGAEIGQFFSTYAVTPNERPVVIIDDIDSYLSLLGDGDSGPFVRFVEDFRVAHGVIILLSRTALTDFECDEHIMSRLRAGGQIQIAPPDESSVQELVRLLSMQRGTKLRGPRISFIARRMKREIAYIEEYLDRVHHLARISGRRLDYPVLSDAL